VKEHLRTAIWRDIIISLQKRRFNSADGDKEEKNMTVKECYEQMGADYEGVLGRLRSEVLIKKFAKKFLDDGSFRSLKDNLYKASFDITEKLRGRDTEGCEELLVKVEEQYNNTVDAIHMMED
jgi:hypothetical protein